MKRIAAILTVFNRVEATVTCLHALLSSAAKEPEIELDIWLTDDGSTDGTSARLQREFPQANLHILQADGSLFWNAGMNNSWRAAISHGGYDGYLWLNNDTTVNDHLFTELRAADSYCSAHYDRRGIYVGSTADPETGRLTYGGFDFLSRWTLKDRFVEPDGEFRGCHCAHGNVTYISAEVVDRMGVLCDGYRHGGGDHDYTYRAYRAGFPLIVLRRFVATCRNDHRADGYGEFLEMPMRERFKYLYSPLGFNLHNTLLFQRRCFPWRYPFVWLAGNLKALAPKLYFKAYRHARK